MIPLIPPTTTSSFDAATSVWTCDNPGEALRLLAGFAASAAGSYLADDIYSKTAQALEELGDHLWLAASYCEKAFPNGERVFPKEERF